MRKLRIAFVHSTSLYPLNGENIKGNCLLRLLVKNGHKVDFIAPYSKNIPKSVKVYPGPSTSRFSRNKEIKHMIFALSAMTKVTKLRKDYDVVYCFGISGTMLAYLLSLRSSKTPILDLYEVDFPELRTSNNFVVKISLYLAKLWLKFFLKKDNELILLSKSLKKHVKKNYRKDSKVIYDAADISMFNGKVRKKHKGFNIIFHGGIEKRDGILNLLKACSMIPKVDFKVFIIGRGKAKSDCVDFVKNNKDLMNKVVFVNWVDYNKIPNYLAKMDLAVVPYFDVPINKTVIPRKVYEYMNTGIPILISDFPVVREVLDDKSSIFVNPTNIKDIAKKIKYCIKNKERLSRMSKILIEKGKSINLEKECKKMYEIILSAAKQK